MSQDTKQTAVPPGVSLGGSDNYSWRDNLPFSRLDRHLSKSVSTRLGDEETQKVASLMSGYLWKIFSLDDATSKPVYITTGEGGIDREFEILTEVAKIAVKGKALYDLGLREPHGLLGACLSISPGADASEGLLSIASAVIEHLGPKATHRLHPNLTQVRSLDNAFRLQLEGAALLTNLLMTKIPDRVESWQAYVSLRDEVQKKDKLWETSPTEFEILQDD